MTFFCHAFNEMKKVLFVINFSERREWGGPCPIVERKNNHDKQ